MKKLAIFVEGLTERIFVETFLKEVIGAKGLSMVAYEARGGRQFQREFLQLTASVPTSGQGYYVQILVCGGHERVKSDIMEGYENLVAKNFDGIIGIRDVYPEVEHAQVQRLRDGLHFGLKVKPIHVVFVLGVMEIETWFITEHSHFLRIDSTLTPQYIKAKVGFDPSKDDVQLRPRPAQDLDHIYRLVGLQYSKTKSRIKSTVDCLDLDTMYLELSSRLEDVRVLVAAINQFLSD